MYIDKIYKVVFYDFFMVGIEVIARRLLTGFWSPSMVKPELGIVERLLEDYRLGSKCFAGIILPTDSDLSGKILIRINLIDANLEGVDFTDANPYMGRP